MKINFIYLLIVISFFSSCIEDEIEIVDITFSNLGADFGDVPEYDISKIKIGDSLIIPKNTGFLGKKRHVFDGWVLMGGTQDKIYKPGDIFIVQKGKYEFIPSFKSINSVPVIIFTFDDGIKSDLEIVFPIFEKYGIRGTSYVIGFRGEQRWSQSYMTYDNWKYLSDNGWDIQCHSFNHVSLRSLNESQINQEMKKMNDLFLSLGLPSPSHHALPFGHYNQEVLNSIWNFRKSIRFYGEEGINEHLLGAEKYGFKNFKADIPNTNSLSKAYDFIDKVESRNGLGVFSIHAVEDQIKSPFQFKTSKENLELLIKYIKEKDRIEILTLSQYFKIVY